MYFLAVIGDICQNMKFMDPMLEVFTVRNWPEVLRLSVWVSLKRKRCYAVSLDLRARFHRKQDVGSRVPQDCWKLHYPKAVAGRH